MTDTDTPTTDLAPVAQTVEIDQQKVLRSLGLDMRDPNTHAVMAVCRRYDLDPVLKHVQIVEGNPYITRDGLLHVAHSTGQLDGVVFEGLEDLGDEWQATVAVYRKDMKHPFRFPGRYPKTQQTRNGPRPHPYSQEMAIKCAEAHALRRAFSVSGIAMADEIHPGAPASNQYAPQPADDGPDDEAIKAMTAAKLARATEAGGEDAIAAWESWKNDHPDWYQSRAGFLAASTELDRMLQAFGAEPFDLDAEPVDAEIIDEPEAD